MGKQWNTWEHTVGEQMGKYGELWETLERMEKYGETAPQRNGKTLEHMGKYGKNPDEWTF